MTNRLDRLPNSLRQLRAVRGLSLAMVARVVGCSPMVISLIERGAAPTLLIAWRLARFYDQPIEEIWAESEARL